MKAVLLTVRIEVEDHVTEDRVMDALSDCIANDLDFALGSQVDLSATEHDIAPS